MAACRHEALLGTGKLVPPTAFTKVFKEECCLCFRTAIDPEGLLVCLSCFHGGCQEHAELHFAKSGHPLAVRVARTRAAGEEPTPKLCKVEVLAEAEPECAVETAPHCFSCQEPVASEAVAVRSPLGRALTVVGPGGGDPAGRLGQEEG